MNSPSSRLSKHPGTMASISTPNLPTLERRFSLTKSHNDIPCTKSSSSLNVSIETAGSLSDSPQARSRATTEFVSASAPGSLQSSPRQTEKSKRFSIYNPSISPEAVDRPKTLPPKAAAELQKHLKEYEEISKQIQKAMDKEAKDKEKRATLRSCREKKLIEYRKVWVEEVIPNWQKKKETKKVLEMWRIGLPPSVRGQIWKLAIGNELNINKELFNISIAHAQQTKTAMFGSPDINHLVPDGASPPIKSGKSAPLSPVPMDELFGKEGTVALVSILDLPMNFPARELFVPQGPMHTQMAEVLEAYVAYRPDVGYAPCMSYLVAGFLLNMDPLDAFTILANFINKPFNLAWYITDRSQMLRYTNTADTIISALLPKIHKHFQSVGIAPEDYMCDWFMTVFLKPLPLDIASRVLDIYFLEGQIFLFKVALALLRMHSHQLESYPRELCINLLNKFPADLSEDTLFENIASFNIDPKKFSKLLELSV